MIPLLLSPIGRMLATAAIVVMAYFGFAKHYEHKGASRVVAQLENKAKVLNEKATAAHDAAALPGAVDRLRKRYCADC